MKRTVRLSLGMSFIMLALVLLAPHLASSKLVLRFLPEDVYKAGKDHPVPSLPKRLLCHLLLLMAAAYMVWAYRDVANGIKREKLSFKDAYKRLFTFLMVEKTFDIVCLDQILCMSTDYYQRCYPETRGCSGWKNRAWNNKNQDKSSKLIQKDYEKEVDRYENPYLRCGRQAGYYHAAWLLL